MKPGDMYRVLADGFYGHRGSKTLYRYDLIMVLTVSGYYVDDTLVMTSRGVVTVDPTYFNTEHWFNRVT